MVFSVGIKIVVNVRSREMNKDNVAKLSFWWLYLCIVELLIYLYPMVYYYVYFSFTSYE